MLISDKPRTRTRWLEWSAGLTLLAVVAGTVTLIHLRQQATKRLVQVLASEEADLELLRREIRQGADVNTRGAWGNALSQACAAGDAELVRDLIARGADIEGQPTDFPSPPAHCFGHPEVTRIMLEHGANPNTNGKSRTPVLHWFVTRHDVESTRLLLDHGADPTLRNEFGLTVFDLVSGESPEERAILALLKRWKAEHPARPTSRPPFPPHAEGGQSR